MLLDRDIHRLISDLYVAGCMKGRQINLDDMPKEILMLMVSDMDRVMLRYRVKIGKRFFGRWSSNGKA